MMQTFQTMSTESDPVPIVEIKTACNSNSVPNHNKVCIKPRYIEGCKQYSTELECYSCESGYKLDSETRSCNYNAAYSGQITHITGCISQPTTDSCDVCAVGNILVLFQDFTDSMENVSLASRTVSPTIRRETV